MKVHDSELALEKLLAAVRAGAPATLIESHAGQLSIEVKALCLDLEATKREADWLRGMLTEMGD